MVSITELSDMLSFDILHKQLEDRKAYQTVVFLEISKSITFNHTVAFIDVSGRFSVDDRHQLEMYPFSNENRDLATK